MTDAEILLKKKQLFAQVYDLTKAAAFNGGEDDAQTFIDLMESREKLFSQIETLDKQLSGMALSKEAESVMSDIKKTAADIVALDAANGAAASRIMSGLKKSLKGINEGRSASVVYNDFIPSNDGMYFDQKN